MKKERLILSVAALALLKVGSTKECFGKDAYLQGVRQTKDWEDARPLKEPKPTFPYHKVICLSFSGNQQPQEITQGPTKGQRSSPEGCIPKKFQPRKRKDLYDPLVNDFQNSDLDDFRWEGGPRQQP